MADNLPLNAGTGGKNAATDEVTYSGDTADVQLVKVVQITGSEGSKTVVDPALHDAAVAGAPTLMGGYAKAAAPTDVDADGDAVRAWYLRNGARATVLTAAGALIGGDATNGLDVDVTRVTGNVTVVNGGTFATQVDGNALTALQLIDDPVFADDAAFTVGTSKVSVAGGVAVAHGSNPDAADALDAGALLLNRHRVQFTIGGHPNIVSANARITGSNTDQALLPGTVAGGTKVIITRMTVTVSNACTVNVGCRIGFGTANVPADNTTGVAGVIIDNDAFPPGGGVNVGDGSGIIAIGGDGEELRVTNDAPTSGSLMISYSYYTIES